MSKFAKYRSPDEPKLFCCYCGKWLVYPLQVSIEHIIPVSRGGNNKLINKTHCCTKCNRERGSLPLQVWLAQLEELKSRDIKQYVNSQLHDLTIKSENIRHLIEYINQNGVALFRNEQLFKQYIWINSY